MMTMVKMQLVRDWRICSKCDKKMGVVVVG
jgi:hypothetical protein